MDYLIATLIMIFVISAAFIYPVFGIIILFFSVILALSSLQDPKRQKSEKEYRDIVHGAWRWIFYVVVVFLSFFVFAAISLGIEGSLVDSDIQEGFIYTFMIFFVLAFLLCLPSIFALNNAPHQIAVEGFRERFYPSVRKNKLRKEKAEKLKQEKKKKIDEQEHTEKCIKHMSSIPKELEIIFETKSSLIINAYRKKVTEDSFERKNYKNYLIELKNFLEEECNSLKSLNKLFDDPKYNPLKYVFLVTEESVKLYETYWQEYETFDFDDGVVFENPIDYIEKMVEKSDSQINYDPDMDPFEYEHYCSSIFKNNGWDSKVTQGSSDQGVDVIAKKGNIKLVAQCKKFTKAVGNKAVQEIVAGIKYYQADIGIVIAPNGFTKSAEKLAAVNKIKLIHHSQIKDL